MITSWQALEGKKVVTSKNWLLGIVPTMLTEVQKRREREGKKPAFSIVLKKGSFLQILGPLCISIFMGWQNS